MSNASHYPSLELCKKLHSIGMRGEGEYGYAEWQSVNGVGDEHTKTEFTSKESFYNLGKRKAEGGKWMHLSWIFIEAYSVMEMLDFMPKWITTERPNHLSIVSDGAGWIIRYASFIFAINNIENESLPNALAEMILWLHENNYISFNK